MLETIISNAAEAAPILARTSPETRARALVAVADALEEAKEQLVPIAMQETGLSANRLNGEVQRTAVQLRFFAEVVADGGYLDVRIDHADSDFVLGRRPDIRRTHLPLGPVINFAASNFPFAFSVLGGDTASIIAAGCPVIVKANPGHPVLSDATAALAQEALTSVGLPAGSLQLIHDQDEGVQALKDPRIKAGAFTGSIRVGRILADIAAARPAPIPFYGELGSVNPVFVTAAAVEERAAEIASGYLKSVGGSAGQLCTKPGFLFAPENSALAQAIKDAEVRFDEQRLLGSRITQNFAARSDAILAATGATVLVEGKLRVDENGDGFATPTIVSLNLADLRNNYQELVDEAFGPISLYIEVPADTDLASLMPEFFEGNLTATLMLSNSESDGSSANGPDLQRLVTAMSQQVGRVLFNDWSTGLAVTPAQQHGGPWPATTSDSSSSVGSSAISRFVRPVAYQNAPQAFLPESLRDSNPFAVPQTVSLSGTSKNWGASFR